MDHPYLFSREGFIAPQEEIKNILADGFAEAFVETEPDKRLADRPRPYDTSTMAKAAGFQHTEKSASATNKTAPLGTELSKAKPLFHRAVVQVDRIMRAVVQGQALDVPAIQDVTRDIATSAYRNHDALICLAKLHDEGDYSCRHGAAVAALAAALGSFLGLARPHVAELALAGLVHDVGKAFSPGEYLVRPDALSPDEFSRLKLHPTEGCALLSAKMDLSPQVLRGVAEHHERHDGSGYPRGLKAHEQSYHGRTLALADVYDALTQQRPYKDRLPPDKAMGFLATRRGRDFDPALVDKFIRCIGVYPVGSMVRLSSGDCAVVSQSNPEAPLCPKVTIVLNDRFVPIHPVCVDLAACSGPDGAPDVRVAEMLDHRGLGLTPQEHLRAA